MGVFRCRKDSNVFRLFLSCLGVLLAPANVGDTIFSAFLSRGYEAHERRGDVRRVGRIKFERWRGRTPTAHFKRRACSLQSFRNEDPDRFGVREHKMNNFAQR